MRILFVHDNFPAQFGPIGDYLARKGWDVYFGTQRAGASSKTIKVFNYKPHREVTKGVHPYAGIFEKAAINGQAAARALQRRGFLVLKRQKPRHVGGRGFNNRRQAGRLGFRRHPAAGKRPETLHGRPPAGTTSAPDPSSDASKSSE